MKKDFNTRLCNDLFPEMPQSFMDGLLNAARKAEGTQNAQMHDTPVKPKTARRFPVRKILTGAAAAVLVAACVVIAVFAPGIGRNKHGAVDPAAYNPLRGRWTLTEVEQNGETVDPETIGLQMDMNFSEDGSVTVTTVTGGAEGQYVYRYTLTDNAVELTAESGEIPVLPASGVYDPETNTLRFANEDGDGAVIFSRVLNKQTLTGIWKQTRREHSVDPSPLDGFDYDYLKWEKEQTWEEDAKPQPWYLEFTADGRMYYFLYAPDGGVQGNQSAPYTISGNTLQWSGWTLRYEAETDTICWILWDRREYYERVPEIEIDDPYREKVSELRQKYPEYFDLYATPRLKVIVWQMAEGSYSCALVPGSDLRKEAEIGIESRGTTIEEMRMILSTYYEARDCNIEPEQVEVVPFHNPISSYWYEIDDAYKGMVRWLITGTSFESDDPLYSLLPKGAYGGDPPAHYNFRVSEVCDIDGDGTFETCMLTKGPTSGLFTFTLTAYHNGTAVYRNTFNTANGYLSIQRKKQGLWLINYDPENLSGKPQGRYTGTVENGRFVLTDRETGETMEYWGLADPHWNMN